MNPFIGTGAHGHTYPGASMPFGMMQLSPDTRMADWDGSSGYHYSDSVIYGFSHTHLSGTGIPDYCDLLFMPFTGKVEWDKEKYRSSFSHRDEKASPGYYEVLLQKQNIKAKLTTSTRAGMHQYEFPATAGDASLLIDLVHRDEVLDSKIEQVSPYELRGYRRSKSWAQDQKLFFFIRFAQPIKSMNVWKGGDILDPATSATGSSLKVQVGFDLPVTHVIKAKVGISGVDEEGAKRNLDKEIPGWNFEEVKNAAKQAWNKELGKIEVNGGTKDEQITFYTALYHTNLSPNIYQDVDGRFRGTDGAVHQTKTWKNYSVFSLWDTYRAYHPLMTIINQQRTKDWLNTFLHQYKYGKLLPVWELSANETFCMIGYHSIPVIYDAFQKGIYAGKGPEFLTAMIASADANRFGLDQYKQTGYISNDHDHESVSKTLEYAYDDWCIAQLAKMLRNDPVYRRFIRRAQNYKNVFDPSTHHMRGKLQSRWMTPFAPSEINNFYTEGNSWQYSFAVPHDIETLIDLHGGRDAFAKKLNELFTTSSQTTGRDQADVTGLIGQYAHGNEPSHHMAYLFSYVNEPSRTQELIYKICKEFYSNAPDGLIGNEDCGQMSAWYVLSSMSFYQVCPGSGEYVIGLPMFEKVTINLENGKKFIISRQGATGNSQFYISSSILNGKKLAQNYFSHHDLMKGGTLQFSVSNHATYTPVQSSALTPSSRINDNLVVPVPYFNATTDRFRDSMIVQIKALDQQSKIFYQLSGSSDTSFKLYTGSLIIRSSESVKAYQVTRTARSETVTQRFHKMPNNYTVQVLSKVHSMYTAGGNDILLDGLVGNANWRVGNWQSYYDQDFTAIVDLKKPTVLSSVGVHTLQDVSPWILYPKKLTIYVSNDGVNFVEQATSQQAPPAGQTPATVMNFEIPVSVTARYIKLVASTGGPLPAWHESAGQPSHLFVDEIIIR